MEGTQISGRDNWRIFGGIMLIVVGVVFLLGQWFPWFGSMGVSAVFFAGALGFLSIYMRTRQNWWALIPAYVFFVIGMIILLASISWFDDFIPGFVLTAIGMPFVLVFLLNRKNWWALIPAYVLISIGTLITFETKRLIPGDLFPAMILWTIALPFFVTYLWNRRNWWALIPGGILATIGAGLAADSFSYLLPIILIGLGVLLLLRQFGWGTSHEVVPVTGPAADKPAKK